MKKLTQRGRHCVLPINGDVLSELRLSLTHSLSLVFTDCYGTESQLSIREAITLTVHGVDTRLEGGRSDADFNPKGLTAVVSLLGCTVSDAVAFNDGRLTIHFSEGHCLSVTPGSGFEAWEFRYPRPGRPPGGDVKLHISIVGDDGRLILTR